MNNTVRANSIRKNRRVLGALGEKLAAKHLVQKGFELIESNYLKKYGEIDLIMRFHEKLHFIEVKSVSREIRQVEGKYVIHETTGQSLHTAEENLSDRKLRRISRVIPIYLSERGYTDVYPHAVDWQFDAVLVYIDKKGQKALVKIIKDIPLPA